LWSAQAHGPLKTPEGKISRRKAFIPRSRLRVRVPLGDDAAPPERPKRVP